jgi:hypothetical protein
MSFESPTSSTGETVVECHCGRSIVTILSLGRRHAVYASALCFYPLNDEITQRWMSEPCLGKHLPSDDVDRKRLQSLGGEASPETKRSLTA